MTETTPHVSQRERLFGGLSLSALSLGALGLLFRALVLTANSNSAPNIAGAALGAILVVLSLVFGVLGRRSRAGRVGMIGSGVFLAVIAALLIFLFSRPATAPVSVPVVPQS